MKKVILSIATAAMFFNCAMAQTAIKLHDGSRSAIPLNKQQGVLKPTKPLVDGFAVNHQASQKQLHSKNLRTASDPWQPWQAIGHSNYDLQSDGSVYRRLINHGNGTLSAIWTMSDEFDTVNFFPNRGTGYNFFDGTSWKTPPAMNARIEGSVRTGFPNIVDLGTGKEFIMAHSSNLYLEQGTNASIGSSTFTFNQSPAMTVCQPPTGGGKFWSRVAVSGANKDTIHVLATAGDSLCKQGSITAPLFYSRSTDGGLTWDKKDMLLPGYDSRSIGTGADEYAIDTRGSIVAIVVGGLGKDVTLWKSIDNGNNFTMTLIDTFAFAPSITVSGSAGDSAFTNDGTVSVFIDFNNVVHVGFGVSQVFYSNATSFTFKPYYVTLGYWDEVNGKGFLLNTSVFDNNADGSYNVGSYTANNDPARGPVAMYGNGSLITQPSIAGDNLGNLFVVFSAPQDNDSTDDGRSFRDVWVLFSTDNGATWNGPIDITCSNGLEEAFPTSATLVDNYLHIEYQTDIYPGTGISNANLGEITQNNIMYARVPVADILAGNAGCTYTGVTKKDSHNSFTVSDNYPNPFTKQTSIDLILSQPSAVTFTVSNVLGQVLSQKEYSNYSIGKYILTFDATQLKSGIYFYTIKAGNESVTKKMVIE